MTVHFLKSVTSFLKTNQQILKLFLKHPAFYIYDNAYLISTIYVLMYHVRLVVPI